VLFFLLSFSRKQVQKTSSKIQFFTRQLPPLKIHIFERGNVEKRRMVEEKRDVLEYKLGWKCKGGY